MDPPVTPVGKQREAGPSPPVEETMELIGFKLGAEEYALDLLTIKEIIRPISPTVIPRTPAFVKGVISLRGTMVPILDLRNRFGLPESPAGRRTRYLVVGLGQGLLGMIVDDVTGVIRVPFNQVQPPPETVGDAVLAHLKGVVQFDRRLVILLDLEQAVSWNPN